MAPVVTARHNVTYAELSTWPDDGRRYELYDGEVSVVPAPLPRHQLAMLELYRQLHAHASATGGVVIASPIDIVFTDTNVLQPDSGPPRRRDPSLGDQPVETRLDGVEIRLHEISGRVSAVEARLAPMDARLEGLDRRLESMQGQGARQFTWMVGLFILTLSSVIGTFLAR
jgi:hypothetical protein